MCFTRYYLSSAQFFQSSVASLPISWGLVNGIKSKMKLCLVCLLARILNYFKLFLNHSFDGGSSDFFFLFYILHPNFWGEIEIAKLNVQNYCV